MKNAEYTYDSINRLTKVNGEGKEVAYSYNGDGLLYERTADGKTTRYYYDEEAKLMAEADVTGGTPALTYVYIYDLSGQIWARQDKATGALQYYQLNGHGDVVGLNDSEGNVLNSYSYDIWGGPLTEQETVPNVLRYSGWDDTTGLQYLRARWYDPGVGRFMGEDTYQGEVTDPLTLNLYTYVHNNPLIYTDPSGHKIWLIHGTKLVKSVTDPENTWTPEFKKYIGELYDEEVENPRWTGGNSKPARNEAAEDIINSIVKWKKQNPDEPIRLIGHSHGGNVAILVANGLHEKGIDVETLVTIATPVREFDYYLKYGVGQHLHVYNEQDGIQINGGSAWLLGHARRAFTNAANIKIDFKENYGPIKSHSVMHSNVDVWKKYITPYLADFYERP
ncbi:RHS repeat domain-containing protein [Paenibacillus medicaginis]